MYPLQALPEELFSREIIIIVESSKMAAVTFFQHIGTKIADAQLDNEANIPDKLQINPPNGQGGDAITRFLQCKVKMKWQFSRWLPEFNI